jgi:drug/metabolite transporter (DMT)-like permease
MNADNNARGIVLMIVSMGAFAIADTLVKLSTALISNAQVTFYLTGGGVILFALMAVIQGDRLRDARAFSPVLLLRYSAEIIGMVGMVNALANVPISSVGAITQASPMLAAIGAVIFLSEQVGWRRWCSIIVGFVGVLLIVQPGGSDFDYAVLWAVLALVALSIRDLTTRLVPEDMPSASLATYTMMAAVPATIIWVVLNGESLFPAQTNWWITIPMICAGSMGYMLLIASLRMAEVSVVMPFRYSRVIYLLIFGVLIFGERPDSLMLVGASLIILSGIYMMWREKRVKQLQPHDSTPH